MRGQKSSVALGTNREPKRAHALGPAIICASFANARSTLSPVFADVNIQGAPWDSAARFTSASFTAICSRWSPNQARLTDRAFPDEADLDLHSLAVHGSPRTGCVVLTRLRL